MSPIGLFFGTTTGKTATVAEMLQEELGGADVVALVEIAEADEDDFASYQNLIVACPTWDIGQLQSDWEAFFPDLDHLDFSGKKVAYLGTGDQVGYADNFMDAMGILEEKILERGGQTVGYWPTDGYEFDASRAVRNGKFVGLAVDEDNQPEMTEERVKAWASQLKQEFGL